MNELQQLFSFDTDEKEYKGIMRLYRTFEGQWKMAVAIDLSDESTASRKVLPWRNDRLPRLQAHDLWHYQSLLINELREFFAQGIAKRDEKVYVIGMTIPIEKMIEFDKVLDERAAEEKRGHDG